LASICVVMYSRSLSITDHYHCILFGARGTVKTTLLHKDFESETTIFIDLLNLKAEDTYRKYPDSLIESCTSQRKSHQLYKISSLMWSHHQKTQQYFDILRETHLAITLDAYDTSVRKRVAKCPKFYFIDTGIKRVIENTQS
jgi:predicted AAA+ superfamily ATPase